MEKMAFLRCPAQFTVVDLNFTLVFGPHAQRPAFSFLIKTTSGRCCFFRIVVSVKSLGQKQKLEKAGFRFEGWSMINIVSKNHTQTRKIERGLANLPLWPLLGWPSPYREDAGQRTGAQYVKASALRHPSSYGGLITCTGTRCLILQEKAANVVTFNHFGAKTCFRLGVEIETNKNRPNPIRALAPTHLSLCTTRNATGIMPVPVCTAVWHTTKKTELKTWKLSYE